MFSLNQVPRTRTLWKSFCSKTGNSVWTKMLSQKVGSIRKAMKLQFLEVANFLTLCFTCVCVCVLLGICRFKVSGA